MPGTQSTVKFNDQTLTVIFSEEKGVCFNIVEMCTNIGINYKSQQKKLSKQLFPCNGDKRKVWGTGKAMIDWLDRLGRRGLKGDTDEHLNKYKTEFPQVVRDLTAGSPVVAALADEDQSVASTIELARRLKREGDIDEGTFIDIVFQCLNAMSGLKLSKQPGIQVVTARELVRSRSFDVAKARTVANMLGRFLTDRGFSVPDMDSFEYNDAPGREHDNPYYSVRVYARSDELLAVAGKQIDKLSDRFDSGEVAAIK